MLRNAYLDVKIGVDTADNEPRKEWRVVAYHREGKRRRPAADGVPLASLADRTDGTIGHDTSLFPSIGHDTSLFFRLVLGCIETKFCIQIRILQHFSKSTKFSSWIFKILQNLAKNQRFLPQLRIFLKCNFCEFNFGNFCFFFFENSARKFCRFWKMLKNAYLDAKFRFDTDENEPKKEWCVVADRSRPGELRSVSCPRSPCPGRETWRSSGLASGISALAETLRVG